MLDRWFSPMARYAPVLLRIVVGFVAAMHGWPKMKNLGDFIANVDSMGFPLAPVLGTAAALSEFLGGLALMAGFFTRFAAFFFGCAMAVAVFKVHWANGFFLKANGFEFPLVLLAGCLSLIFSGSGPLSLDFLFGRKK